MVSARKDLERYNIINNLTSFLSCIDLATAKSPSFIVDFKEPDESIGERSNHVGFELMHSDSTALLFRYNELKHEFAVKHVPALDHSISARSSNQVVLVELMKLASLFDLELSRRKVLVVCRSYSELRRVARLDLDGSLF